jgi:hypothetical protein
MIPPGVPPTITRSYCAKEHIDKKENILRNKIFMMDVVFMLAVAFLT